MAVTVSDVKVVIDAQVRVRFATVTLDSSYASGGEALTASDFGLYDILAVFPAGGANTAVWYDSANKKLLTYKTNTSTNTNTTITDIGLLAVPTGTDLSGIVIQVLVIGN